MTLKPFQAFCQKVNAAKQVTPFEGRLLAFDPGETTGFCVVDASPGDISVVHMGQLKTYPMTAAVFSLETTFATYKPTFIVLESYRVYSWKTDTHSWSDIPTLRIIGCIETLCIQNKLKYHFQTAQEAKHFCTDDKLQSWLMYEKNQRHARDATRHAAFYLLFGNKGMADPKKPS